MMTIDEKIKKHSINSKELKKIYIGNKDLKYDKTLELMKQQNIEYQKMIFFKNLKKEMIKNRQGEI